MNAIRNVCSLLLITAALWLGATLSARADDAGLLGADAPAFRLQDQNGKWHALEDYRGQWVALYFYPKDQTPGCTTQACEFRDNVFAFRNAGAVILGVSVDDVASHRAFAEKHGLPFSLLADDTKATARSYGVLRRFFGLVEIAGRETFLIDPQGRIARHYADVDPRGHSEVVLRDIKTLQGHSG